MDEPSRTDNQEIQKNPVRLSMCSDKIILGTLAVFLLLSLSIRGYMSKSIDEFMKNPEMEIAILTCFCTKLKSEGAR